MPTTVHPAVVIVGAGQAGCQVAVSLRELGHRGRVALVGAEEHLPYQRPPLSKGFLNGSIEPAALQLRPAAWFAEHDVELVLSRAVASIDTTAQRVHLEGGDELPYDALVLALGGRHRPLDLPGTDLEGVLSLRHLDEAADLRERLGRARSLAVVGGGFVGLEVAATGRAQGAATTVVEAAPRLMGRVLSDLTSGRLAAAHAARGVRLALGAQATRFAGHEDGVTGVQLADGEQIDADLVLVGIGALPEVGLANVAGLLVEDGVVVDHEQRTSDPHVFAVGDCARGPQPFARGESLRLESVQSAVAQARTAAAAVCGLPVPEPQVPWFWSQQGDLKLQIAGLTTGHDLVVPTEGTDHERFSTWCFRSGELVGVESVNQPAVHLQARSLLTRRVPLSPDDVRRPGFDPRSAAVPAR